MKVEWNDDNCSRLANESVNKMTMADVLQYIYESELAIYQQNKDIFYDAQPYPSWSLNSVYDWEPPIPEPDDDLYYWDEDAYQNDDTTGWCLPNFQPVNGEEGGEELIE